MKKEDSSKAIVIKLMKQILHLSTLWLRFVHLPILILTLVTPAFCEVISFQASSITVSQTAGSVSIPVVCTGETGVWGEAVDYDSQNGTAIAGTDYQAVSEQLDFYSPGTQYISIPIIYTGSTADRHFSVFLSNPFNAQLGAITSITVTIKAEPILPPVVFNLSQSSYSVKQNAGAIQIPVSFTNASRFSNVWVEYATQDGSATTGTNYVGTQSKKLNFTTGSNTALITIPIYNTNTKSDQTFSIFLLSSSEGALGSRSLATVTILKAPPEPKVQILTTAGPTGIPFTIYGTVTDVKRNQIRSVQFVIGGKKMMVKGKQNWSSRIIAKTPGSYRMIVTVTLTNGKKLKDTKYLIVN